VTIFSANAWLVAGSEASEQDSFSTVPVAGTTVEVLVHCEAFFITVFGHVDTSPK